MKLILLILLILLTAFGLFAQPGPFVAPARETARLQKELTKWQKRLHVTALKD
jgi:hypothetical protein